jgi:hypothetical protein
VTTTSATYGAGTGTNVAVTATTGTTAMVIVTGAVAPANNQSAFMSFAVSGATTQAATDARAVAETNISSGQASTVTVVTGLTAGSNTFTANYRSTTGTATFTNRTISVIPLG